MVFFKQDDKTNARATTTMEQPVLYVWHATISFRRKISKMKKDRKEKKKKREKDRKRERKKEKKKKRKKEKK